MRILFQLFFVLLAAIYSGAVPRQHAQPTPNSGVDERYDGLSVINGTASAGKNSKDAKPIVGCPAQPKPVNMCGCWDKFGFDTFEVRGRDWNPNLLGENGQGLRDNIRGCGLITDWHFLRTPDNRKYDWKAIGNLPILTCDCVGKAVVSAGGASGGYCGQYNDEDGD